MTDDASTSSTTSARTFNWKKVVIVFLILLFLISIAAGSAFAYFAYKEWTYLQTDLISQRAQYQSKINYLQNNIHALQQNSQQTIAVLDKQAQVLKQIEGIEKNNIDIWRGLSAAYLVRLANDQVTFTHDANVLPLLERAIEVLQPAKDPALRKLQQTLRADVLRFKAIPIINIANLYDQLININNQLDSLPLQQLSIKSQNDNQSTDVKQQTLNNVSEHLPWWKAGWRHSMSVLKKIIIVHRQEENSLPFILPQQATLFYQSMHAQLQNAIWGLLNQAPSVYENSLSQLIIWLQKYVDTTQAGSQQVLLQLQTLKNQSIQPTKENLTATAAEFDQYFAMQDKPPSTP